MPGFRQCLAMPPALYLDLTLDQPTDLDGQMAKTLLDYKSGRPQQAYKRFLQAKKAEGLDPGLRLVLQQGRLTEGNAPLLIFELLFQLMAGDMPASDTVGLYLDTLGCFDPDDAICHGAMYNSLILIALRRSEPALAERLALQADESYRRCGSTYLRGFVHLHLAFIRLCMARPAAARDSAQAAGDFFAQVPQAISERAVVEITGLWIEAEASGRLPALDRLASLQETLATGEFWPETFMVFAGMILRATAEQDPGRALTTLAELEAILRLRGMTLVLPVMQLLREDHRSRLGGQPASADPPALAEELVLLILPDADTVLTNWGAAASGQMLAFDRMVAARDLLRGRAALRDGRFDLAAGPILSAVRLIQDRGLGWLARQSRPILESFCQQAQARRLFLEQARSIRDTILARPDQPGLDEARPQELTQAEYGIVQRLDRLTSNKILARELGVTEAAVKFHLKNIYRKLGVHDRRAALQGATARGWIAPPTDRAPHHGASGR